jgi:tRNA-specific 2-thiouridylase
MDVRGKKVFVGLSGGVDSAVTASLLKEAGAQVTGVFIKGWYPEGMPCTWAEDRRDAMRVAAHLRIPFRTLDASDEYKKGVIDYLLREYKAGRTPNPDVMCNREVKFGAFYEYAMKEGADMIATGHYARMEDRKLLRGVDEAKDQSYFLWAVPKEALEKTLFPLGRLKKDETRKLAKKLKLPNAEKRDSQGICFLGSVSVEDFLRAEFGSAEGRAVDETGKPVGTHDGVLLHTLGERVSLKDASPGPWYVVKKDISANVMTVSHAKTKQTGTAELSLSGTNFLAELREGEELTAQYRYHGPRVMGMVANDRSRFLLASPLPEPVAEGQSLVLYRGDECVGGGIIGV